MIKNNLDSQLTDFNFVVSLLAANVIVITKILSMKHTLSNNIANLQNTRLLDNTQHNLLVHYISRLHYWTGRRCGRILHLQPLKGQSLVFSQINRYKTEDQC